MIGIMKIRPCGYKLVYKSEAGGNRWCVCKRYLEMSPLDAQLRLIDLQWSFSLGEWHERRVHYDEHRRN